LELDPGGKVISSKGPYDDEATAILHLSAELGFLTYTRGQA
jgi:hypothetical protein